MLAFWVFILRLGRVRAFLLATNFVAVQQGCCSRAGHSQKPLYACAVMKCGPRRSIVASRFRSRCRTHWDVSLRWSAMRSDEPPPGWLSAIWRFIKVRGPRRACASRGFFYFMESLISRGSLASARRPVLMNAAGDLSAQCASSSSSSLRRRRLQNASHDKQERSRHITQMC